MIRCAVALWSTTATTTITTALSCVKCAASWVGGSDLSLGQRTSQSRPFATVHRFNAGSSNRRLRRNSSSSSNSKSKQDDSTSTTLEWESFEYSDSPKWDPRFASSRTVVTANEEDYRSMIQQETDQDEQIALQLQQQYQAWQSLSDDLVSRATVALLPFVKPDRVTRIKDVLQQRTQHTRFLFENPSNPSNVWSCLRTLDSFGIQHVDVVIQSGRYQGKAALTQKRGMRTAMGSAQWLTVRNHLSTADAVTALRRQGNCRILASDVSSQSKDIRSIQWNRDNDDDRPICIVMGNEEHGISDEMRLLADETFSLPMVGFAESFNLSVATAITLAHLSAASSNSNRSRPGGERGGPIRPGDLPKHEFNCLLLKGLLHSVSQKRVALALLRKEGIELPQEIALI